MSYYDVVYEIVKRIPRGKVATYGMIALLSGSPKASRAVGYALHFNPMPGVIPCHRVVNRFGRVAPAFAFGGPEVQADLLRAEGVPVVDGEVINFKEYLWNCDKKEDSL